jgi:hypothetical protein
MHFKNEKLDNLLLLIFRYNTNIILIFTQISYLHIKTKVFNFSFMFNN